MTRSRTLEVLLLVVALLAVGVSACATARQSGYVRCQAHWSQAYAAAAVERAKATDDDRHALDQMVASVVNGKSDTAIRQALLAYQAARTDADRQRAAHPLPALPDTVCQ